MTSAFPAIGKDHTKPVPLEVLGEVFAFTASPLSQRWDVVVQQRYDLALVCKNWTAALYAQRFVWSFLSVQRCTPQQFITHCLERAKSGTLTLELDATLHYDVHDRGRTRPVRSRSVAEFVALCVSHVVQALPKTVGLLVYAETGLDAQAVLRALAPATVAQLQAVRLLVHARGPTSLPSAIPTPYMLPLADNVEQLQLWSIFDASRTGTLYHRLVRLKLANLDLDWSTFRSVLTSSATLQMLALHEVDVAPSEPAGVETITLAHVKVFDLRYATDAGGEMAALLDFPQLDTLKVDAVSGACVRPFLVASPRAVRRAEYITISACDTESDYVGQALESFLSAKELDLRNCSWEVAPALMARVLKHGLRLPRLQKLQLPTSLTEGEAGILLHNRFSPDVVLVASVQNHRIETELMQWKKVNGQVVSESMGLDWLDTDRCGWALEWY